MPIHDEDALYLSTAQAAEALAVGVSTVKRWVDEGVLPAHRTAGGHRKLLRAEVLALARKGELPRDDWAGLVVPGGVNRPVDAGIVADVMLTAVLRGDARDVRAIVRRAYRSGLAIETLADRVIAPVMHQIGHEWQSTRIDVWHEHRGTQMCTAALYDLLSDLDTRAEQGRPTAIGGAPEGDPYVLATLLAQLVLLDAGWEAVNLGPNTPFDSLIKAMNDLRPRLIWISASHLQDPDLFVRNYSRFYETAERVGAAVAVGGGALTESVRSQMLYTTHGDGMSQLAAFARSLHPRPSRPRRGRPRKT